MPEELGNDSSAVVPAVGANCCLFYLALRYQRCCDIICFDEHPPRGEVEAEHGLVFLYVSLSVF